MTKFVSKNGGLSNPFYQETWPADYRQVQIAFVVDDLIAAARKWAAVYGIGPFYVMKRGAPLIRYRGEEMHLDHQVAVSQAGPVQIELVQQFCDSPSIYRDLFAKGTGGAHHMCTVTNDYDGTKAHYEALGYTAMAEISSLDARVAYFDTDKDFGLMTEVVEHTEAFRDALKHISEVCQNWDGTDPVRKRTRDGYIALE